MSVEEYLAYEDPTGQRYEFRNGEMIAMAGGTEQHSVIAINVGGELRNRLRGTPCRPYSSDLRVQVGSKYYYPDCTVVCGAPEFQLSGTRRVAVRNSKLIIEILSESTEAIDRGEKFSDYRTIESFQQYVLISQARPMVETFLRQDDGAWRFATFTGLKTVATLSALGIDLPLSEIYAGVEFESPGTEVVV